MISGALLDRAASPLAALSGLPRRMTSFRFSSRSREVRTERDRQRRAEQVLFHLGRGRIARQARHFECGAAEARRALAVNPQSAWALALLGQCLQHQQRPDLVGARRALERAQALDPTNGYFVGLLLDVLDAQGDAQGRADTLAWAWWNGAPVERWLPDGPPIQRAEADQVRPSSPAWARQGGVTVPRRELSADTSTVDHRQPVSA